MKLTIQVSSLAVHPDTCTSACRDEPCCAITSLQSWSAAVAAAAACEGPFPNSAKASDDEPPVRDRKYQKVSLIVILPPNISTNSMRARERARVDASRRRCHALPRPAMEPCSVGRTSRCHCSLGSSSSSLPPSPQLPSLISSSSKPFDRVIGSATWTAAADVDSNAMSGAAVPCRSCHCLWTKPNRVRFGTRTKQCFSVQQMSTRVRCVQICTVPVTEMTIRHPFFLFILR